MAADIKFYAGYTTEMCPMQAGRIREQLDKRVRTSEYGVLTYKNFIIMLLFDKWFLPVSKEHLNGQTEYFIADLLGTSPLIYRINKTQYGFADYLNKTFEDMESIIEYDTKEQFEAEERERIRKAQEEEKRLKEEERRTEGIRYKAFLKEKARRYVGTTAETVKNEIFAKTCKDLSEKDIKTNLWPLCLIVCIDDIDNERARNVLSLALHPSNKASTRFIEWYAGVKFPRKVKEREQFIMELSSEKINKQDIAPAVVGK